MSGLRVSLQISLLVVFWSGARTSWGQATSVPPYGYASATDSRPFEGSPTAGLPDVEWLAKESSLTERSSDAIVSAETTTDLPPPSPPPYVPATWSTTELQFQYGKLDSPSFAGGGSAWTRIFTIQHSSGWRFGDNFVFLDVIDDSFEDGFNDRDVYLEWYSHVSLGKVLRRDLGWGPLADIGALGGLNYGADAEFLKWTPGLRLAWKLPGFTLFNTDFTAYLDDSGGLADGGAPSQTDSFMIDCSWIRPFSIGRHDFSVEGHVEFIGPRRNELGQRVAPWVLGQPQFRYDLGKTLGGRPKTWWVGVEWQMWPNKLGDGVTDENALQALLVWRL